MEPLKKPCKTGRSDMDVGRELKINQCRHMCDVDFRVERCTYNIAVAVLSFLQQVLKENYSQHLWGRWVNVWDVCVMNGKDNKAMYDYVVYMFLIKCIIILRTLWNFKMLLFLTTCEIKDSRTIMWSNSPRCNTKWTTSPGWEYFSQICFSKLSNNVDH